MSFTTNAEIQQNSSSYWKAQKSNAAAFISLGNVVCIQHIKDAPVYEPIEKPNGERFIVSCL